MVSLKELSAKDRTLVLCFCTGLGLILGFSVLRLALGPSGQEPVPADRSAVFARTQTDASSLPVD